MLFRSRNSPFNKGIDQPPGVAPEHGTLRRGNDDVKTAQEKLLLEAFERYEPLLHEAIAKVVQSDEVESVMKETYERVAMAPLRRSMRNPRVFLLKTVREILMERLAATPANGDDSSDVGSYS